MTLRIGLIGAGGNTKLRHIPGFKAIDDVEIVAVCNRTRASGERVAREYGIEMVCEDWRELVAAPEVDAVCIGTWPYMHCSMTLEALEYGKHVLTEARMAMDLAEARRMLEASEASDRVAMVVPAPFYLQYEPTLLDMLGAGDLGDLLEIHVSGLGGGFNPDAPRTWRQNPDLSGNNIMVMGILNETVRRYVGHERSLVAMGKTFIDERIDAESGERVTIDLPDSLGIVAEHLTGATCVYHISDVARGGRNFAFEMHGSKGSIRLEAGRAWVRRGGDDYQALEAEPARGDGWRVEAEFVDAILEGTPVTRTNFADGVKYMQFTEAVQLSLKEGRRVRLSEL